MANDLFGLPGVGVESERERDSQKGVSIVCVTFRLTCVSFGGDSSAVPVSSCSIHGPLAITRVETTTRVGRREQGRGTLRSPPHIASDRCLGSIFVMDDDGRWFDVGALFPGWILSGGHHAGDRNDVRLRPFYQLFVASFIRWGR